MGLEVCVFNREDAYLAQEAGATRLELCANYAVGGITPPMQDLEAWAGLSDREPLTVPSLVMLRPRAGDFIYTKNEKRWIMDMIHRIGKFGFQGVVLGSLLQKGSKIMLDTQFLSTASLLVHSLGMEMVLHRCFDELSTPFNAVSEAQLCGVDRILTAWGLKSMETLKMLRWHASEIAILPGGGIRMANMKRYTDLGFKELHTSCLGEGGELDIDSVKQMLAAMKEIH